MRPLLLTVTSCTLKKKKKKKKPFLLQILQTSLIGHVFGTADLICLISHKQLQVSSHTDPGIANLIKTTGKS